MLVVLWSPIQKAFHIETKDEMFAKNIQAFMRKTKIDYITLGEFPSRKDCDVFIERLRESTKAEPIRGPWEPGPSAA